MASSRSPGKRPPLKPPLRPEPRTVPRAESVTIPHQPEEELDEATAIDATERVPLPDPRGTFDVRFLKGLLTRALAVWAAHLPSVAWPVAILVVGGLADLWLSVISLPLALAVAAAKGVAWANYLAVVAHLVRGTKPKGRVVASLLVAAVMMLQAYSFGVGSLLSLVFFMWPVADFASADPSLERFLRSTVLLLRKSGTTWYLAQLASLFAAGLLVIAVDSLGGVLLGSAFGTLLAAVVFAPAAHVWALARAVWCHRW